MTQRRGQKKATAKETDKPAVRRYETHARSTDTFGRVLCSTRDHHYVVDGPVHNGCPGEAVTPAEIFLSGVASCGVELLQVLARAQDVPLRAVAATVQGEMDPARPVRPDVSLFNAVRVRFELQGVDEEQGARLVESFKRR